MAKCGLCGSAQAQWIVTYDRDGHMHFRRLGWLSISWSGMVICDRCKQELFGAERDRSAKRKE